MQLAQTIASERCVDEVSDLGQAVNLLTIKIPARTEYTETFQVTTLSWVAAQSMIR